MQRRPWQSFTGIESKSFVVGLVSEAKHVSPDDLVDMSTHAGDFLRICLAYAQDELTYTDGATPRDRKVNKFGLAYRRDAKFLLHKTLAAITADAAAHLYQTHGWTTVLYDGLRTVNGAYNLYLLAADSDMESGLLSLPGTSAHNKGMAVDSMMEDRLGNEIDMHGHFDHLDMSTNGRTCTTISPIAYNNRLIREAAFLRSAFAQGLLVAPLRNEFWDDRLPENREDLWRVLDSAARCIGITLLTQEDDILRKHHRNAFEEKWERWSYADFLARWAEVFAGHEEALQKTIGTVTPPLTEKPEFYHGNYHPIYDDTLRASGKHLTEAITGA